MHKKIFLLLFLFLIPVFVGAEENYSWSDLDQSCFEKNLKVDLKKADDFLLDLVPDGDLFFISQGKLAPSKIYSYGKKQFLSYKVVAMTGVDDSAWKNIEFLNDNNPTTKLFFDSYNKDKKIIDIELDKMVSAHSFNFNINYPNIYKVSYYISERGQSYIHVSNPENFDFKFLRIEFSNSNQEGSLKQPLYIAELNFTKRASRVYVVDNSTLGDFEVYAGFRCKNIELEKKVLQTAHNLAKEANFSIDANTDTYSLSLQNNPLYDNDFDGDYIPNNLDNCPFVSNQKQTDTDKDLIGDACDLDNSIKNFFDKDSDGDQVADSLDNCPHIFNPKQEDGNADHQGDLCSDDDRDGIIGYKDNCINIANKDQADINVNGVGDACEFDKDLDGVFDSVDNCINIYNPDQRDSDKDYIGDECDNCEFYNPRQIDKNNNKIGDVCEKKEEKIKKNDKDGDSIIDSQDNCPSVVNVKQEDEDSDGIGDLCDNCLGLQNPKQEDKNNNKIGDKCEDSDGDGIVGYLDNCMYYTNKDQADSDNDGVGDVCEDDDGDGIVAVLDNCPFVYNKDQANIDGDALGDKCDDEDNRFIESNKPLFISFIIFIVLIFSIFIILMIRKISANEKASNYNLDEEDLKKQNNSDQ